MNRNINNKQYIDIREPCELDERLYIPAEVHFDGGTRVRVFSGQLMDTVIEDVTSSNYLFQAEVYFRFGNKLLFKFPDKKTEITDATMIFWQRLQTKLKEIKEMKK